jgi:hypothetical protein
LIKEHIMAFNFTSLLKGLGVGDGSVDGNGGGGGTTSGIGGNNGTDWMSGIQGEAQEGIKNSLAIAAMSKELSMSQALGKFMKAAGDACKSMAP